MQVRASSDDDTLPRELDLEGLAHLVRDLPIRLRGGRAELIAALHRRLGDAMATSDWWTGVAFGDLIETGEGILNPVWSDPLVASSVVRPIVAATTLAARTRRALAQVIGAPAVIADQVDAEELRIAWDRVGSVDARASSWLGAVRRDDSRQRLERDLAEARASVRALSAERDKAAREQTDLAKRIARLESMLQEAHGSTRGMTRHEARQHMIDALTPLAELAVEAETLAVSGAPADLLVEKVRSAVARHGLQPIGRSGSSVSYQPSIHDVLAAPPREGSAASVLRPGYTWQSANEEVVLMKALVSAM
jgi:hypothetical protein